MPTVADRLCHVTLKVKRANEHISDFQRERDAFLNTKPYAVGTKRDPKTRQLIYYVTSVKPPPKSLALIAGDAIQNLITALDHLAYQIVCSDTGDCPPAPNKIYFPIANSAGEYERLKARKIQGANPESIAAIDILKPYRGGNDLLWQIHALNSIEKHRLLLPVGSCSGGFNIGQFMAKDIPSGSLDGSREFLMNVGLIAREQGTPGFPLEPGYEILIDAVDAELDPNLEFSFDIALSNSEIIEAPSILITLHESATMVQGIVSALTYLLKP